MDQIRAIDIWNSKLWTVDESNAKNISRIVLQSGWQLETIVTIKTHEIIRFVTHVAYLAIRYANPITFFDCFKFDSPNILIFSIVCTVCTTSQRTQHEPRQNRK